MSGPNMTYCMFENTTLAIDQIVGILSETLDGGPEAIVEFKKGMSREELRYYRYIMDSASKLIESLEMLEEVE